MSEKCESCKCDRYLAAYYIKQIAGSEDLVFSLQCVANALEALGFESEAVEGITRDGVTVSVENVDDIPDAELRERLKKANSKIQELHTVNLDLLKSAESMERRIGHKSDVLAYIRKVANGEVEVPGA